MLILPDVSPEHWRRFHVEGQRTGIAVPVDTFRRWERIRALSDGRPSWSPGALVSASTLRERQHRLAPVLQRSRDVLGTAIEELARRGFAVVIANEEGIILASWGADGLTDTRYRSEFVVGARWDESTRGTNAIGTALAERRSVAVLGASHYLEAAHGLCCYAALIENPEDGSIVVLDITGPASSADPLLGVLTISLATALEAALHADAHQRTVTPSFAHSTTTADRLLLAERDRLVAEASVALSASLDLDDTLDATCQVALDVLADWVIVDLVDADGRLARVRTGTRIQSKQHLAEALAREVIDPTQPALQRTAIDHRRPVLIHPVTDEALAVHARNPGHHQLMRDMELTSVLAIPLLAGQSTLGAILLASSSQTGSYSSYHIELANELARRIAVAIANAKLHRAAQEAADARADVLAIVAHDLRSPLNAIGLTSELLQRPQTAGSASSFARTISSAAQRMNRLIEDLLEASRSETDRLSFFVQSIDPQSLLAEAHGIGLALGREIVLEAGALPNVRGDRDRLLQVFTNLLGNAAKFSPRDGTITLGGDRDGDVVRFWVRDQGPGLAPTQLARVFERFWKADRRDRRGAGLGLYISKRVVEDHGGAIGVDSEPGAGATFWFTVPIA